MSGTPTPKITFGTTTVQGNATAAPSGAPDWLASLRPSAPLPASARTVTRYVLAVNTYLCHEDDPDHPVRPITQGTEPVVLYTEVASVLTALAEAERDNIILKREINRLDGKEDILRGLLAKKGKC